MRLSLMCCFAREMIGSAVEFPQSIVMFPTSVASLPWLVLKEPLPAVCHRDDAVQ